VLRIYNYASAVKSKKVCKILNVFGIILVTLLYKLDLFSDEISYLGLVMPCSGNKALLEYL
jgi:hypothetical protein